VRFVSALVRTAMNHRQGDPPAAPTSDTVEAVSGTILRDRPASPTLRPATNPCHPAHPLFSSPFPQDDSPVAPTSDTVEAVSGTILRDRPPSPTRGNKSAPSCASVVPRAQK